MTESCHVHPDLVGAAGVDFYLQKGEFTVCTLDLLCDLVRSHLPDVTTQEIVTALDMLSARAKLI